MNQLLVLSLVLANFVTISITDELTDITKGPPAYDKPWVPGWGYLVPVGGSATSWRDKHLELLKQTQQLGKNIKVVFLGDSLTDYFQTNGKSVWTQYYANTGAYNYGIGGDSTREVLWRIQHGEFDGLDPKLLTLMIGTNNLNDASGWNAWDRATDDEIVKAIRTILDQLHEKLPNTKILLLSILPQGGDARNTRIKNINTQASHFKDDKIVFYLDIYQNFVNSQGKQLTNLFSSDTIHPNQEGYSTWAKAMQSTYNTLLNS